MTLAANLQTAAQQLHQGEPAKALELLLPLSRQFDDIADVWQLLALAYKGVGELPAAESAFLKSIALNPQPHVITNLANLYRQMGNPASAIERYDEALRLQPNNLPAQVNRGRSLMDLGQFEAAERAFDGVLSMQPEHINARIGLAQALQQQGRQQEAVSQFQQVLQAQPDNSAALNGLGISLKVLGYADDAVAVLQQGAQQSPESPEIHSNLASALAQADRQEEAVAAYKRAVALDGDNPDFHDWYNGYLGVLDHPEYLYSYREALERRPDAAEFAAPLARKLLLNDRGQEAEQVLKSSLEAGGDPSRLNRELSHVLREQGKFDEGLASAREAYGADGGAPENQQELANAILAAAADYQEAVALLEPLVEQYPYDQGVWALYATALRYAQEEARYRALADYDRLVNKRYLTPPEGFSSREEFVAFVRDALLQLHTTRKHPVEQSMVNGTQTLDDLFSRRDPAVGLLANALHQQLLDLVQSLPVDHDHPLLRRNTRRLGFSDSWSVRLREQGFHKNHFHSEGWLSSAVYLIVPEAVHAGAGEGWIKFGEPGFKARDPLQAEYWVKPEEGALVVFPSYLWHGTEPLKTARERMTVGYDILPV